MKIWSADIAIDKNEGWFVGAQYCALFHVDFIKKSYEPLVILPSYDLQRYEIYRCCNKVDEAIYVFPRHIAGNILVISTSGQLRREVEIKNPENVEINIVATCVYKDKIYAMSLGLHKIIAVDIKNNTITDVCGIYEDTDIIDPNGQMMLIGNDIYCAIPDSNVICKLNLEEYILDKIVISSIENGICSFGNMGNKFWITSKEKRIYIFDRTTDSILQICMFPENFGTYKFDQNKRLFLDVNMKFDPEGFFFKGIYLNEKVWLVPRSENKVLYLDVKTLEIEELPVPDEVENEYTWDNNRMKIKYYMCYIKGNRYIGIYSFKNKHFIEIDTKFSKVETINLSISRKDVYWLSNERIVFDLEKYGFVQEIEDTDLQVYLDNIYTHKELSHNCEKFGLIIQKEVFSKI